MATYRTTRNIEASVIEFLREILESTWTDVKVEKSFAKIYEISLPSICVSSENTVYNKIQIGDNSFERNVNVIIDLFCENDGQRLDLKDTLIEGLKDGCPYYDYTTTKAGRTTTVTSNPQNGRIRILKVTDTPVNIDVDKDNLDVHDRFRHRLSLTISLGRIE
jgi:hypothetical protein